MTVNEAENELRSRACATGVASWMWNYDVEDGTITLSLTAGKEAREPFCSIGQNLSG